MAKSSSQNRVLVNSGTLSLYGAPKVAWSLLAQNIMPGEDYMFVTGASDWAVGDELVAMAQAQPGVPALRASLHRGFVQLDCFVVSALVALAGRPATSASWLAVKLAT